MLTPPMFTINKREGSHVWFYDVRQNTRTGKPVLVISRRKTTADYNTKQIEKLTVEQSEFEDFKKALAQVFGFIETLGE